jgi:hypothetical protein
MADNITYKDANAISRVIRATEDTAAYTPHSIVATLEGDVPTPVSAASPMPLRFEPSSLSAFGTLETAELTPVIQGDFNNGVNVQLGVATTANSGSADAGGYGTAPNGRLRLQSGTNAAGSASFISRIPARYRAGQGMVARFTGVFTDGVVNSTQIVGVGNAHDGYFFGFNGASFGILHRNSASGSTVNTWTAKASWNVTPDAAITPTFGNVFMVKYPYLGYGDILFFAEDSKSGRMILVHIIRYANTTADLQLSNPNLSFYAQTINSGATTNQILYCGSYAVFVSGERSFAGNPKWAFDNNKSAVSAETSIFGLRNATSYNGGINRSLIRLNSLSCASASNAGVFVLRLRIGAALGGSPSYAAINGTAADNGATITAGNSIASTDTAATTATGGTLIYNITLANGVNSGDSVVIDLVPFNIFVAPGETLTVSGFSTISATVAAALNWTEDI